MILEDILENAAHARPGYTLASFKEAALPVYLLTVRILTLDRKPLNPIEEGCLRAIHAGLSAPNEISSFLGLPRQVLNGIFAGLNARECINYTRAIGSDAARMQLTVKGQATLKDLQSVEPQERVTKLVFDPFLKRVLFVPTQGLLRPKEVKENGWLEAPLCGAKRPEVADVPLSDIDKALQRLPRRNEERRELLALRRIERREMHFLPCTMLFYRAVQGSDVQVAFYKEDGFSLPHEAAFRELGGPDLVGANGVLKAANAGDFGSGASPQTPANEVEERATVESDVAEAVEESRRSPAERGTTPSSTAVATSVKTMTQRYVRCHEHPRLLQKALRESTKRLLIISPWINHQVVNQTFVEAIQALLDKGVVIHVGYGIGKEVAVRATDKANQKAPITDAARRSFEQLRSRYSRFNFHFIGNTHRKQLVSDGAFAVVTSFNWLSFKGDPKQPARDELGFLVTNGADVDKLFSDGLELFDRGYDHPTTDPAQR